MLELLILDQDAFVPSTDRPAINASKLPKTIPVFRGYTEELVCEADGHPPPKIQWLYNADKVLHVSGGNITVSEAGLYNCTATNEVDSTHYLVKVISKGTDNLWTKQFNKKNKTWESKVRRQFQRRFFHQFTFAGYVSTERVCWFEQTSVRPSEDSSERLTACEVVRR